MTLILGGERAVPVDGDRRHRRAMTLLIMLTFRTYARILKYLTLSLFAYAGVLFLIHVPWLEVMTSLVMPKAELSRDYLTAIVAIFGTTISPYLFFWQASHEVEQQRGARGEQPLHKAPSQGPVQLRRVKWDTLIGMAMSNLVAFCIMLTAATVLLHAHGKTEINSAAEAAQALKPIAGDLSFFLFAAGIVGTGMLASPTLAGSAAYAVAETFDWPKGLDKHLFQAGGFYGTVALGTHPRRPIHTTISVNPMKALFWSAVLQRCIIAIPLMVIIMLLSSKKSLMKKFVASRRVKWGRMDVATVIMFAAFIGMVATM